MPPAFGAMDTVHEAETAGGKIGDDQLSAGQEDAEHLGQHAVRIVHMMDGIHGDHGGEAGSAPRQTAGIADNETDTIGHARMRRLQPGTVLFPTRSSGSARR